MSSEEIFNTAFGKFSVSENTDKRSYERFKKGVFYQESDVRFLENFISSEMTVLDIGAHIGTTTIPFAHKAKKVFSFEPVAVTRNFLEKNIALNDLRNVTVYPYALGDVESIEYAHAESNIDAAQYSVSKESRDSSDIRVEVKPLDSLVQNADLIKIDAEGMEMEVLKGAVRLIERNHPTIFCEINYGQLWRHGASPALLERFLRKHGYSLYIPLGERKLGRVPNLSLLTGLSHPAFFLKMPRNYAFDILAFVSGKIPESVEIVSPARTVIQVVKNKLLPRLLKMKYSH